MNIDWDSTDNLVLLNPRFSAEEEQKLYALLNHAPSLKAHVWIATSGSSGQVKWTALSKQAILLSAQSVNHHLNSDHTDIWLHGLPDFHVGGLGIRARSYLSGAQVITFSERWNPEKFHQALVESKATLISLVPAQVYDLVVQQLSSPPDLRGVIVGGGQLTDALYQQARTLGWPLLPSYGLTECASQVATARPGSPELHILSHVECRISEDQAISINSESLLSMYGFWKEDKPCFVDPKQAGWFTTEDKGEVQNGVLRLYGRTSQFVKIGGESVDLSRLESILERVKLEQNCPYDLAVIPFPDERLGHVIHLCGAVAQEQQVAEVMEGFQKHVLPFERIRKFHIVPYIPRTSLKKLIKNELLTLLRAQ